jgi:hypothetical protein
MSYASLITVSMRMARPEGPWFGSWYDSLTYKKATALDLPATGSLAVDITAYPQPS